MAIINRGYSFLPTEEVTNVKLRVLVENAEIQGIHWSEFSGGLIAISSLSAPTPTSIGWVTALYECMPLTLSSFTGIASEHNYHIEGPTGPVALFKMGGFETRRFACTTDAHRPGGVAVLADSGNSATLSYNLTNSGSAAIADPRVLGSNTWQTGTTSPTDPSGIPRLTIRGLTGCRTSIVNEPDGNIRRFLFRINTADETWNASSVSNFDKMMGISMQAVDNTQNGLAFLWGSPVWRL